MLPSSFLHSYLEEFMNDISLRHFYKHTYGTKLLTTSIYFDLIRKLLQYKYTDQIFAIIYISKNVHLDTSKLCLLFHIIKRWIYQNVLLNI